MFWSEVLRVLAFKACLLSSPLNPEAGGRWEGRLVWFSFTMPLTRNQQYWGYGAGGF